MWKLLASTSAHHSEPADPVLMGWIKQQIDDIFGLDASIIVAVLAAAIFALPLGILIMFLIHRSNRGPV